MENELLHIHDSDPSTEGGPPGWIAVIIIMYLSLIGMGVMLLTLVAISS